MKRNYSNKKYKKPYTQRSSNYSNRVGGTKKAIAQWKPEMKYFDVAKEDFAVPVDTSWASTEVPMGFKVKENGTTVDAYTASSIIPSAVGTGYGQIIGQKYWIKQIRLRGHVEGLVLSDQADARVSQSVRIIMVQDTMPQGAQAQGEDIFTDFGASPNIHSFLAMGDNPGRFKILGDKKVTLQGTVAATDGTNTNSNCVEAQLFSMYWKPKTPLLVNLKGPSGVTPATAQLSDNNIFLLCITTGAASTAQLNVVSRCYYYE